ncbi:MAG TPA: hypothetical protein VER33_13475 [Polyangiaceae bacterium]|nr:hypothetical protein [Polyangiaceae bacterium]
MTSRFPRQNHVQLDLAALMNDTRLALATVSVLSSGHETFILAGH